MNNERNFFDEDNDGLMVADEKSALIPETDNGFKASSTSRHGAIVTRIALGVLVFVIVLIVAVLAQSVLLGVVGFFLGLIAFVCCHVIMEWERAVVVRFGRFHRVVEPGIVFTIPFVDSFAAVVDTRMRSTAFRAERVLTSDLVPVNVDAVLFWGVFDARLASFEVRNFERLVFWVAQTTLRDVMGSTSIAQLSTRRVQIDKEVAEILERKTSEWGIAVTSVEIRDIVIPESLQDTLSIEAQAKQEYNARVILAEAEKEVADMFMQAAEIYRKDDGGMQLRAMDMVYNGVKEKGGLVVIPSAVSEAFEGLGDIVTKK